MEGRSSETGSGKKKITVGERHEEGKGGEGKSDERERGAGERNGVEL